jgi:hypothetical protein
MFNVVGKKKTEWYEPCSFFERPESLKFKCRFYLPVDAKETVPRRLDEEMAVEEEEEEEVEEDLCKVCRKTTLSMTRKPLKNVLICDGCEAEVHLGCSSLKTMPSEDESFHCESCASKRLAAPQAVASEISSVPTPAVAPAAAATTCERVCATAREFYNLSGDDPDLYDAQNCMALVEMEWVRSKKQYRLANDVVRMLDTKLASL